MSRVRFREVAATCVGRAVVSLGSVTPDPKHYMSLLRLLVVQILLVLRYWQDMLFSEHSLSTCRGGPQLSMVRVLCFRVRASAQRLKGVYLDPPSTLY